MLLHRLHICTYRAIKEHEEGTTNTKTLSEWRLESGLQKTRRNANQYTATFRHGRFQFSTSI